MNVRQNRDAPSGVYYPDESVDAQHRLENESIKVTSVTLHKAEGSENLLAMKADEGEGK